MRIENKSDAGISSKQGSKRGSRRPAKGGRPRPRLAASGVAWERGHIRRALRGVCVWGERRTSRRTGSVRVRGRDWATGQVTSENCKARCGESIRSERRARNEQLWWVPPFYRRGPQDGAATLYSPEHARPWILHVVHGAGQVPHRKLRTSGLIAGNNLRVNVLVVNLQVVNLTVVRLTTFTVLRFS